MRKGWRTWLNPASPSGGALPGGRIWRLDIDGTRTLLLNGLRPHDEDLEFLFRRVPTGTPVYVF